MDLPKSHIKSAKGQILILFLLVLIVGVAIVLSVASRTITDIRTTTTSDESNRAYFAAEAGIEEALQELQSGGTIPATGLDINFPNISTQAKTEDVTASTGLPTIFVYPDSLPRDDVAQVALLTTFSDLTSGSPIPNTLNFFWGSSPFNVATADETPAIEVSVVFWDGSSFGIRKFTFDPYTTRGNNFCTDVSSGPGGLGWDLVDSVSNLSRHLAFKRSINIVDGEKVGGCRGGTPPVVEGIGSTTPVLARIRMLYNPNPEPVAVTVDSGSLPAQGAIIESTGTTASGVTRKLQVTRLYPALPGLFDYVLFSGIDLSK